MFQLCLNNNATLFQLNYVTVLNNKYLKKKFYDSKHVYVPLK